MELSQSLGNLSHHAYCIVGAEDAQLEILSFLKEKQGVSIQGNPDVFVRTYEILTIDDARELKDMHATRPFSSRGGDVARRFFVIVIRSITHEAQNALLKMLEEPNGYALFFIVIPSDESLLPTVRSRLYMVRTTRSDLVSATRSDLVRDFLASPLASRVAFADKLSADISDGKKPKSAALEFCADLSKLLHDSGIEKNAAPLAAIARTESYLRDRAASVKQLLEYMALSV